MYACSVSMMSLTGYRMIMVGRELSVPGVIERGSSTAMIVASH
jgi:hypothetical protein